MHNKELKAKFQKFWVNTNLYYCWKVLLRNYKSKNIEVVCTAMYPLVNDPYSHDTSIVCTTCSMKEKILWMR